MNFAEGVRRVFVVLQWLAVVIALGIGWADRPQARPMVAADFPKISDEQLVAAYRKQAAAEGKPVLTKPHFVEVDYDPFVYRPTWVEWAKHLAQVALTAAMAYLAVFALWKLLHWVGSGFAGSKRGG